MANMVYCRFQNTSQDLADCLEALEEGDLQLSEEENRAKDRLVQTCYEIVAIHEEEIE